MGAANVEEVGGSFTSLEDRVSAGVVIKLNALIEGAAGVTVESEAGNDSVAAGSSTASPPETFCSVGSEFMKLNPDIPNAGDGEVSTRPGSEAAGGLMAGVCMKSNALIVADGAIDAEGPGSLAANGAALRNANDDTAAGAASGTGAASALLGVALRKEKADGAAADATAWTLLPPSSSLAFAPLTSNPPNIGIFFSLVPCQGTRKLDICS